jgi:hypothetical protein
MSKKNDVSACTYRNCFIRWNRTKYFKKGDKFYGFADYIYQKEFTETYKYPLLENVPSTDKGKKIILFQPSQLNYYIKNYIKK